MIPALLHAFSKPTSENFKTLVRSEGVRVWDENGKEYIDGLGGLWYCQVGHSRPELIDAITEQLKKLSSYGRVRCFPILEYALILDKFF